MIPWNKNKSVGQKKPISDSQIEELRKYLASNPRDLALFSLQIDSMLRSSDVIKLKVKDILDFEEKVLEEINIKQRKTKRPHIIALSDFTIKALTDYIAIEKKTLNDYLFPGYKGKHISYETHRAIWKNWCKTLGIDPTPYSTHTGRRTKPAIIYEKTKDPKLLMELLGHEDIKSTTNYMGMTKREALDIYKAKFLK
jgi:integrase